MRDILVQKFEKKNCTPDISVIFVLPEFSSGRDIAIQMSVRRTPSKFFVRRISLELYKPYLDDILVCG